MCLSTCLCTYLSTYSGTCLITYLGTCLSTCSGTCPRTGNPTHPQISELIIQISGWEDHWAIGEQLKAKKNLETESWKAMARHMRFSQLLLSTLIPPFLTLMELEKVCDQLTITSPLVRVSSCNHSENSICDDPHCTGSQTTTVLVIKTHMMEHPLARWVVKVEEWPYNETVNCWKTSRFCKFLNNYWLYFAF